MQNYNQQAQQPSQQWYPPPQYSDNSHNENRLYPEPYAHINASNIPPRPRGRTPSPTRSEARALRTRTGEVDWQGIDWKNWKSWFKGRRSIYWLIAVVIITIVILLSVFNNQIVDALRPATDYLKKQPWGWVIPIVVLFIVSFPPLFGHSIVAVLCGVTWGPWIGLGIVSAGTLLGEIGNYYTFRYMCSGRSEKLETSSIMYGCLARVIHEGGFKVALIARYSSFPAHFTTAIFATCGMVVTIVITIAAYKYLLKRMDAIKEDVIYKRRKARQEKLERATEDIARSEADGFNPSHSRGRSETHIPLNTSYGTRFDRTPSPQPAHLPPV